MKSLPLTRFTVLALLLATVFTGPATAAAPKESPRSREFSDSRILVRLHSPLPEVSRKGHATRTGTPVLDAVLTGEGVVRIDSAIPNSFREPRSSVALRRHGLDRTYRFHVAEGKDVRAVVERLSQLPEVVYAELDHTLQLAQTFPNDPMFDQQWGLHQAPDLPDVDAPEAWDISVGEAVVIAVLDSGIDATHVEFQGKLVEGWNFDGNNGDTQDYHAHGTAMSSIIAADTNNNIGIAGMCWNCLIMPLKAGLYSAAADALVWAADHGASVVNISQGIRTPSQTFAAALAYAFDAGLVVVAASGNDAITPIRYPAMYPETIAVGATDDFDQRVVPFCFNSNPGSSYGPRLDVVAPGELIVMADSSTAPGGEPDSYYTGCGTSAATALVTGVAGVVRSLHPTVGREEMRHLIRSGAEDQVGNPLEDQAGFDPYYGWGRVNMARTLRGAASASSLRLEGAGATRLYLDVANPLAESYDFVRGSLGSLSESWQGVDLGDVVCLENDSPDPDTAGNEDSAAPQPGEAFFYLARFNSSSGAGSYGGSASNRDRRVFSQSAARWTRDGNADGDWFGYSVGLAGDVNSDNYDDVIVGVRSYTNDQIDEGGAFIYLGGPGGLQASPIWTGEGDQTGATYGNSVSTAGDVDGDGFDDVLVGAPFHDNGQTDEGRAYLFLGATGGPGAVPAWIVESNEGGARLGTVVAAAGDVNGDGFDDVIVTAPFHDGGQSNEGRAYVYHGSPSGLGTTADWIFEPDLAGARLGFGAGGAGDVNGDGYDDVVLGAHRYSQGQTDEGALFVFLGSDQGLGNVPTTIESDVAGTWLGRVATTAGDVNGDGFSDIVVTANRFSNTEPNEGGVFVYLGSTDGPATSPAWTFESDQADAHLGEGSAAATAGDMNGDGFSDLVVGAYHYDSTRVDEGKVWVFLGSASGLSSNPWSESPGQALSGYGVSARTAGDVDNDGYDDIIVGAYVHDGSNTDAGRAYVYHGSSSGVLPAPPTSDCAE